MPKVTTSVNQYIWRTQDPPRPSRANDTQYCINHPDRVAVFYRGRGAWCYACRAEARDFAVRNPRD